MEDGSFVRLRNVQLGDLTLFDRPSEFSRRVAVVSPTVFILALPGSLHSPQARGCHALIRQGAVLVETAQDIFSELAFVAPTPAEPPPPAAAAPEPPPAPPP